MSYDDAHGRRLWYCDIQMDMGEAYFPFVRLALARYQPQSIANAHLSRVVLADFIQLLPDRAASITFDPIDPTAVQLAVNGLTYTGPGAASMIATIEMQPPGSGDPRMDTGQLHFDDSAYLRRAGYTLDRAKSRCPRLADPGPSELLFRSSKFIPAMYREASNSAWCTRTF